MTDQTTGSVSEYHLLEAIEAAPNSTQAELAAQVGVAVGTVNWYLKRWSQKGYVKARRMGRWNWHYLLTSEGMARKARLAREYVDASLALYRRTREDAKRLGGDLQAGGYDAVFVADDGEIGEIFRLTCLEMHIRLLPADDGTAPVVRVDGTKLGLWWPNDGARIEIPEVGEPVAQPPHDSDQDLSS